MQVGSSTHPSDHILRAFANGSLDARSASAVGNHLDECQECLQKVVGISSDGFLDAFRRARPSGNPRQGRTEGDGDTQILRSQANTPGTVNATLAGPSLGEGIPEELANHPDY